MTVVAVIVVAAYGDFTDDLEELFDHDRQVGW